MSGLLFRHGQKEKIGFLAAPAAIRSDTTDRRRVQRAGEETKKREREEENANKKQKTKQLFHQLNISASAHPASAPLPLQTSRGSGTKKQFQM